MHVEILQIGDNMFDNSISLFLLYQIINKIKLLYDKNGNNGINLVGNNECSKFEIIRLKNTEILMIVYEKNNQKETIFSYDGNRITFTLYEDENTESIILKSINNLLNVAFENVIDNDVR